MNDVYPCRIQSEKAIYFCIPYQLNIAESSYLKVQVPSRDKNYYVLQNGKLLNAEKVGFFSLPIYHLQNNENQKLNTINTEKKTLFILALSYDNYWKEKSYLVNDVHFELGNSKLYRSEVFYFFFKIFVLLFIFFMGLLYTVLYLFFRSYPNLLMFSVIIAGILIHYIVMFFPESIFIKNADIYSQILYSFILIFSSIFFTRKYYSKRNRIISYLLSSGILIFLLAFFFSGGYCNTTLVYSILFSQPLLLLTISIPRVFQFSVQEKDLSGYYFLFLYGILFFLLLFEIFIFIFTLNFRYIFPLSGILISISFLVYFIFRIYYIAHRNFIENRNILFLFDIKNEYHSLAKLLTEYVQFFREKMGIETFSVKLSPAQKYQEKKIKPVFYNLHFIYRPIRFLFEYSQDKNEKFIYSNISEWKSKIKDNKIEIFNILNQYEKKDVYFYFVLEINKDITGYFGGILGRHQRELITHSFLLIIKKQVESRIQSLAYGYELRDMNRTLEAKIKDRTATIERQKNELEKMNHLKTDFFARITHDIKTPLSLLTIPIDSLLNYSQNLTSEQINSLHLIKSSSYKVISMINDTLDHSRLEGEKMKLYPVYGNITRFIRMISEIYGQIIDMNGMKYQENIEKKPVYLFFDPEKLEKVINNLLGNAIKYNRKGRTISLTSYLDHDKFWIKIRDEGSGISLKNRDQIFLPYYQINDHNKVFHSGSGLGLANVKEMINMHSGEINVISKKDVYTEFYFFLPMKKNIDIEIMAPDISNITFLQKERWISFIETKRNRIPIRLSVISDDGKVEKSVLNLLSVYFEVYSLSDQLKSEKNNNGILATAIKNSDLFIFIISGSGKKINKVVNDLFYFFSEKHTYRPSIALFINSEKKNNVEEKFFNSIIHPPIQESEMIEKIWRLYGNTRGILNLFEKK